MKEKMLFDYSTAYSDERQQKYYILEDKSWWFQHRASIFLSVLDDYFDKSLEIMDIGGSNGFYSKLFQDNGYKTTLVEPTYTACDNARRRGVSSIINATFQELDVFIPQFVLLDVLEHIADDSFFLRNICDKMLPNGMGLIAVPAFMALWSSEDEIDGHFRRYRKRDVIELVKNAGFEPLYYTYFFQFLWVPIYIFRHLREKLPFVHKVSERTKEEEEEITNKQFLVTNRIVKKILNAYQKSECGRVDQKKYIPFGSSFMVVVRKNIERN